MITLNRDGVFLNNHPITLLCSSLFYFRIPKGIWRDRMKDLKSAGYNCIDIYFPWNFHETSENEWDFSAEKDVSEFLRMARDEGLYIVARPGPYICSEWDGGALPAYLFVKEGIRLRDNEPVYLSYVEKWMNKILPIIREYEYDNGGTVIMLQLENELDFYKYSYDRFGYMGKLYDIAIRNDISVPIIACSGTSDIGNSGGLAERFKLSLNLYPDSKDKTFDEKVFNYYSLLDKKDMPLLVTETNKEHFLIRRLLSCGAKLLSPYNQAGGNDYGFTNATNNWGDPLSFQTSDYDFTSMLTVIGERTQEYYEGRLLGQMINSLGESLALSKCSLSNCIEVNTDFITPEITPVLNLKNGGELISITNLSEKDGKSTINFESESNNIPKFTELKIPKLKCIQLLKDYPLFDFGISGKIKYATCELSLVKVFDNKSIFTFYSDSDSEICLSFDEAFENDSNAIVKVENNNIYIIFENADQTYKSTIRLASGKGIIIYKYSRSKASKVLDFDDNFNPVFEVLMEANGVQDIISNWRTYEHNPEEMVIGDKPILIDEFKPLEAFGIYKGYTWYQANFVAHTDLSGIKLVSASEIVSIYINNIYFGTYTPAGNSLTVPFEFKKLNVREGSECKIVIRVETWGHSNFDDGRLPVLNLNSTRGLGGIFVLNGNIEMPVYNILITNADETALGTDSFIYEEKSAAAALPLYIDPGKTIWLYNDITGYLDENLSCKLRCKANNVKLTVFFNGKMTSRLFLDTDNLKPCMRGGHHDIINIAKCCYDDKNILAIYAEAINKNSPCVIESFELFKIPSAIYES